MRHLTCNVLPRVVTVVALALGTWLGACLVIQTDTLKAATLTPSQEPASTAPREGSSTGGNIGDETNGEMGGDVGPDSNEQVIKETGPAAECDRLTAPKELTNLKAPKPAVDWDHALTVCQAALDAHPNEPHFHLALGIAYYHAKRYIDAFRHYRIAADANIPAAQSNLGHLYFNGLGTVRNDQKAFELWSKAAEAGWPAAMGNLSIVYAEGRFVKKDPAKSLDWSEKAIEAGNVKSLSTVANIYLNGLGVDRDFAMAAQYFQQGADLGDGYALKSLANMYEAGFMGAPQPDKAGALRLLAQQLDPDSGDPSPLSVFKAVLQFGKARPQAHHTAARRYVVYRRYRFYGCGYAWC